MMFILMGSLRLSLMETFSVFIQWTLRGIRLSRNGYLASTGLDSQSPGETELFSPLENKHLTMRRSTTQGFMEGDGGVDDMQV